MNIRFVAGKSTVKIQRRLSRHPRIFLPKRHSPCTFRLLLCHILFCSVNISHSKRIVLVTCNTIPLKNRIWFITIEYLFLHGYIPVWRFFFSISLVTRRRKFKRTIFFKVHSKWREGYQVFICSLNRFKKK